MKLRLHAGELRLRLKQDEVARLADGREVDEAVAFGPHARLTFAIVPREDLAAIAVSLHEHRVVVELPSAAVRDWAASDEEGLYRPADGPHPAIAVEKDFKCLHRDDAPDEGAFPHPRAARS